MTDLGALGEWPVASESGPGAFQDDERLLGEEVRTNSINRRGQIAGTSRNAGGDRAVFWEVAASHPH